MNGVNRYFVVGVDKGKSKTYLETDNLKVLNDFVRYVMHGFNKKNSDLIILDWHERKQVNLLDYARENDLGGK